MVDQTPPVAWDIEHIPDAATLFYRVHITRLAKGELAASIFFEVKGSMSVEWEKYATAAEAHKRSKVPASNGIVALRAGEIRDVPGLAVQHSPTIEVRAHADVLGLENSVEAPGEEAWAGLKQRERYVKVRERLFAVQRLGC
jgi:hypothetical protein